MKINYFILLLIFIPFLSFGQCPVVLTLDTQAEIDAFATNYPDCNGSDIFELLIIGEDITNLNGLSQIEYINGFLTIVNTNIQDFTGLNNLTGLGITFTIENNQNLINFVGLENLTEIPEPEDNFTFTGGIRIRNNENLINFTGLNNLQEVSDLFIVQNNQSLIDLTGLESLTDVGTLRIDSNENLESLSGLGSVLQITDGDLQRGLIIEDNSNLTSLDGLIGLTGLVRVSITNIDLLTNLDGLQNISMLRALTLSNNDMLTDISAIEFVPFSEFAPDGFNPIITDNPLLSNCSIISICTLFNCGCDAGGDALIFGNNSTCASFDSVYDSCSTTLNQITGNIQYDIQGDGCDTSDFDMSSVLIEVTNSDTNTVSTHSDQNGNYTLFVGGQGTYTTRVVTSNIPSNLSVSPDTVETVFSGNGEGTQIDFCVEVITPADDLKITILQLEELRPGFDTNFQLVVENLGTQITDGIVTLTLDTSRVTYLSSTPVEGMVNEDEVLWTLTDINPFSSQFINFTINSLQPPINESDDLIDFIATIDPIVSDETPQDNINRLIAVYVNSQDPNDKMVNEGSEILEEQVGEYLNYLVRFQNIGTADAINVRVDDVLDDNLELDSFRVLSSSHDYQLEITDGNNVSFIYDDINLPSIEVDEEGSNGFVAFQIRTKDDLELGSSVSNTANIFFDFNAPIVTNTVVTTVVEVLSVDNFNSIDDVSVFPNPVVDIVSIEIPETIRVSQIILYSLSGKKLETTRETTIDISGYSTGVYFLKIITTRGSITKKIIKR